jgi:hypothetical protein
MIINIFSFNLNGWRFEMVETFDLGDLVEMKKQHPCGSKEFEVIRLGADIKIKCTGCGRIIMLPRSKFQKEAKKIVNL